LLSKILRSFIREVLKEGGPTMASGVDPTNTEGQYSYEIERGNDIHSYWYRSPGRGMGGDGDPGRPSSAEEYIGLKPKTETSPEDDLGMNAEDVMGDGGEETLSK
jgi:hypothetical protein